MSNSTRTQRWTELLLEARQGNRVAYDQLIDDARPGLRHKAFQSLGDMTLAEDVASRAFIKAWNHRESFDPAKSNAGTWLYHILGKLLIDENRRRTAQQTREVSGFDALATTEEGEDSVRIEPEDDVEVPPPEEADQPRRDALLHAGLARLSPGDQQILRLCHFEGLSYEEIAARMNIKVTAVGPRLTRARDKLREVLHPEGVP